MSFQSNIIGLCAVAVVVLIPPLAWHSHSKNIAAIILITWLLIMDISYIVSAAIWSEEDFMVRWDGKGWCDVITKLQVGANVGISCAVTTIIYNLHIVLRADSVLPDVNSWRKICRDLALCLVTPIMVMGFSYLLQGCRFGIARYNGCINLLSPTWVTTVLYTMWALIWSSIAAIYASSVLYIFYKKRKDVRDILHCTNSKLNLTRFSRLLIFCFLIILVMFPLSIYAVVGDVQKFHGKYSFRDLHSKSLWNIIPKYDAGKSLFIVWLYVLMSYLVFLIFGLGDDALRMYSNVLRSLKLGFIVDTIERLIHRNKKNRLSKLLGKISSASEFSDTSFSDSSMEKSEDYYSTFQSSSPGSQSHFFVDYKMPYETKRKERRRQQSRVSSNDKNKVSNVGNFETPKNKFMPFSSDRLIAEDDISLDGISGMSVDKNGNHGVVVYTPSTCNGESSTVGTSSEYKEVAAPISDPSECHNALSLHYKFEQKRP